jgi:YD repeat-containing protein
VKTSKKTKYFIVLTASICFGRRQLVPLFALIIAATPLRLFAQTFANPAGMNDFSDAMVETPNTAMIIEPAAAPSYGPTDDGPGAPGEDPSTYTQSDDHNPVGVSGAFEGVTTTGCGYNVLNHAAVRAIDDIVVPGCIGKYPLKMTRYFVSRGFGILGGLGPGWRHEYSWSGGNGKFEYPNGNVWDSTCAGQLAPPGPFGVSDWPGNGGFRLADGGTVRFDQYGRANQIIDPYGQTTTIAYADNANPPTMRVTEPGSRYLLFTYGTTQNGGGRLLSKVEAYDGRGHLIDSVTYHYTSVSPGGRNPQPLKCLTRVDYSDSNPNNLNDSTHAHYTYTEDNVPDRPDLGSSKLFPLVLGCDDVRYNGPMRRIAYLYQTQAAPHGAILQERYWDGFPGHEGNGPMVSGIDPPASSPLVQDVNFETIYTETRGDGPTRKFTYSPLHITRSHDVAEPCPTASPASPAQQFLQSYTDFATPPKTTQLGYDNNWYVNSVTDANLHTTLYTRGDPPSGGGIGEIKKITHSDGSYIDYAYSDTGHYLTSVTFTSAVGELRNQTIHTRDPYTHLITRTDYRGENSSLLAYEEFTWCDAAHADPQCGGHAFGQLKTHHLKNGAYVHYRYDPRGLLIDKWEPTWNPSASEAEPKTHYDYYSSGPWTDRVMAVTGPPPNWTYSQQAAETYEYDLKSDGSRCAGRGLVTKITHADGKYQSFQYNQWGNKVNEWNETGERTQYAYDDYNRATNVTKYM